MVETAHYDGNDHHNDDEQVDAKDIGHDDECDGPITSVMETTTTASTSDARDTYYYYYCDDFSW